MIEKRRRWVPGNFDHVRGRDITSLLSKFAMILSCFFLIVQQPNRISKVRKTSTSSKRAGATHKETIVDKDREAEEAAADAMMKELIKQEEEEIAAKAKCKKPETKVFKTKMI